MDDSKFGLFAFADNPIFLGGSSKKLMAKELSLCVVDAQYLRHLHKVDYRVSVKYNNRPFVGIFTMLGGIEYVIRYQ